MDHVEIDGSLGEGGGQILRSALALSLVTGRPLRVARIRAGRRKPGLLRQHLTGVKLAARIGAAHVVGDELGSQSLTFEPQALLSGTYEVEIGTAGSTSLVAQTVVPALLFADAPSALSIRGGTHARAAPPFEFLRHAYVPALAQMGAEVAVVLERAGFFPVGGGELRVQVSPIQRAKPLDVLERGDQLDVEARALLGKLPRDIAERELAVVQRRLGWPRRVLHIEERTEAMGPGNALVLRIAHENATEVITSFGAQGVPAERVAAQACRATKAWLRQDVPVSEHLADQLLLPMALGAGGRFRTEALSSHSRTNVSVIEAFLGNTVELKETDGSVVVCVRGREDG